MFPAKYSQCRGNTDMVAKQKLLISLCLTLIDVPANFISHVCKDFHGKFIAEGHRYRLIVNLPSGKKETSLPLTVTISIDCRWGIYFYLLANKDQSELSGEGVIKVTVFTAQHCEGAVDLIQTFEMEGTTI